MKSIHTPVTVIQVTERLMGKMMQMRQLVVSNMSKISAGQCFDRSCGMWSRCASQKVLSLPGAINTGSCSCDNRLLLKKKYNSIINSQEKITRAMNVLG